MTPIPHQSETVAVDGGGVPVAVRRAGAGAALVIVPSAFGITDDLVAQMEALAPDAGPVVAMDLFWRGAPGPVPYDDMKTVMGRIQTLDRVRALDAFRAVVAWARAQPGCDGRVVGLGVCFGGPFAFLGAADGLLQGVVTWHGTRLEGFLENVAAMRCPMSLHFGARDRVVPMEAVERVREAFAGRGDVEVVVHPGADHGFTHASGPTWDAAATASAMAGARRLLASA
jgi:carboxymethylenebutenolidase